MRAKRFTTDGAVQNYEVSYETLYNAALAACADLDLNIREESFEQKYIIAKKGGRTNGLFINYGELVGIYFRERNDGSVDVRVASERIYKPGFIYYEDWAYDVQAAINSHLS